MARLVIGFFLLLSPCIAAQEQEDKTTYGTITTDRPDQTESPFLVPKGLFQFETGFSYEETSNAGFKEKFTTYNSTLVRYGLLENLELRLGLDIGESKITRENVQGESISSGFGPLYAGFKIGIATEKGLLPEMAFLGGTFLPFPASEAFKPEGTGGEFRFSFAHTLSENWGFSYNLGAAWNGDEPTINYLYSVVLSHGFTEKLSGFVEVYGNFPEKNSSGHLIDGGVTYLLSDTVQIDISGGTGLTTNQDFFVGTGISFRLPK